MGLQSEQSFQGIDSFMASLNAKQRAFFLAWETDRESRLQDALKLSSRGLSALSALLSESTQLRLAAIGK